MEYHEAVDFLFDLRRFQVRPGIESAAALRSALDDPGDDIRFVQVAGSNGKGSTAKLTESVLREAGYSVGLYTSPHLETLNERIQVDGRPITDRAITEFVEQVKPWLIDRAADGKPLTFFEVVTLLGIWYFDRQDVDVAVLEVGLGGEFDATSVIDPVASCVTTISLEHTSVLGDTVAEIAATKAAVAPDDGTPLVTGTTGEALATLRADAGDVLTVGTDGTTDVTVGYDGRVTTTESRISVSMPEADDDGDGGIATPAPFADGLDCAARLTLLGEHQAVNAGIATTLAGQVAEYRHPPSRPAQRPLARSLRGHRNRAVDRLRRRAQRRCHRDGCRNAVDLRVRRPAYRLRRNARQTPRRDGGRVALGDLGDHLSAKS